MTLTPEMAVALASGDPRGLLVQIEHPSGTGYFSTGVGKVNWNGHDWLGTGKLGSITPIKYTSDISVQDIAFSLSGIDLDTVNQLNDSVCNLSGKVWLYCLTSDGTVVREPYQLVDSQLDYQKFEVDAEGKATITIVAHSGFYTLVRSSEEAWTPENQKLTYPTDTGLDMLYSLQNQDLQWTPS
ncbi:hypothetical protein ACQR1I_36375 [Bradyrhizobium sp. HKCCYLS2038]|uniref:hypothetical protein n=1 Tax=Bradyrhizobium sp. HKCCYLS2038 TaxID=3420764 RepID=UPI003EBB5245